MKLTTKGNYALSALLDLTVHTEDKHISLREISERLDLSENYLRQLFMEMKHSGLVDSIRGVGGGYFLAKRPEEIKILDIIEAVEGKICVVPCLDGECQAICPRYEYCSARNVWDSMNISIKEGLATITLRTLTDEYYREKRS